MESLCTQENIRMTVGELVYALQQQPEDLQVVFPDYLAVTRVVRVKDKSLPKNLEDVVIITDEVLE